MTERNTATPHYRFGLRRQLIAAFGFVTLLMLVIVVATSIGLVRIRASADQAIEKDGQLAILAARIQAQTLQCRRYEKDIFLNIDDPAQRARYLDSWNEAFSRLETAIEFYEITVTTTSPEDLAQVREWRTSSQDYKIAMLNVLREIDQGTINTPQAANEALRPSKDSIRSLTSSAIAVAEQKDQQVTVANQRLTGTLRIFAWGIIISGLIAVLVSAAWAVIFPRRLMRPVLALQVATQRLINGEFDTEVAIEPRRDELGELAVHFNTMAAHLRSQIHELQGQREEIQQRYEEQQTLVELIRELETPILPLLEGVFIVPLVGHLDTRRAASVTTTILETVHRERGRTVIIDITGISAMDTTVAQRIEHLGQALQLLGVNVILSGISPSIANTMTQLGIQLDQFRVIGRLQDSILSVLKQSIDKHQTPAPSPNGEG